MGGHVCRCPAEPCTEHQVGELMEINLAEQLGNRDELTSGCVSECIGSCKGGGTGGQVCRSPMGYQGGEGGLHSVTYIQPMF